TTLRGYANDFLNSAQCEAGARSEIARGAGVLLNVAGACGLGTLRAAKEQHVWGIGVDVDQSFLGPQILTSVLKGAKGQDIYLTIKALTQGKLRAGGNSVWDLANGAVGLGRISASGARPVIRRVDRDRAAILTGPIKVPAPIH